jgi:pimeloyl-ACP methyl ester carboxylesterase
LAVVRIRSATAALASLSHSSRVSRVQEDAFVPAIDGKPNAFLQAGEKISVPSLVMHGDDDQIVPYADSGPLSAELLKNGTLKTYKGFPHGMRTTEAATINADLLAFIRG